LEGYEVWEKFLKLLKKDERVVLGLMSGTSADGLDIALVKVSGKTQDLRFSLEFFKSIPYPKDLREKIIRAYNPNVSTVKDITELNFALAREHVKMIKGLGLQFDLIGYHGQTVYHMPEAGATLQLGEADVLAVELGVPVVHSFRTKDMALGGQGAPIVSYFDWVVFGRESGTATLNIGGIANLTYLSKKRENVIAFDTGPGNCLIDVVVNKYYSQPFDIDGKIAKKGKIRDDVIELLMMKDADYIEKSPPKTTGRERYNEEFLDGIKCPPKDLVRTLTRFTALSIHLNIKKHVPKTKKLIVTGGGAFNPVLTDDIRSFGYEVEIPDKTFVEAKEAIAIAVLANEFLNGVTTNIPNVTGAEREATLGKLSLPF